MSSGAWICPSCQAVSPAEARYCAQCGERRLPAAGVTETAQRWWRTLGLLVAQPGALTCDHRDGRRRPRVPPLTLFLAINVAFFVAQALSGLTLLSIPLRAHLVGQNYSAEATRWVDQRLAAESIDRERYAERFDARQLVFAKSTVLAMVPLLAAVCALLYAGRRQRWATHWTFALHFYAFALLFMTGYFIVAGLVLAALKAAGMVVDVVAANFAIAGVMALAFGVYVSLASRRVYGLGARRRIASSFGAVAAVFAVLQLHRFAVFGATLLLT